MFSSCHFKSFHHGWTSSIDYIDAECRWIWIYSVGKCGRSFKRRSNIYEKGDWVGESIPEKKRRSGRKTRRKNPKRQWYIDTFKLGNFLKKRGPRGIILKKKTTLNSLLCRMKIEITYTGTVMNKKVYFCYKNLVVCFTIYKSESIFFKQIIIHKSFIATFNFFSSSFHLDPNWSTL